MLDDNIQFDRKNRMECGNRKSYSTQDCVHVCSCTYTITHPSTSMYQSVPTKSNKSGNTPNNYCIIYISDLIQYYYILPYTS